MKLSISPHQKLTAVAAAMLLLAACAAGPTRPIGADNVRSKLTQLQGDPELSSRAPVAIKDAEAAVQAAEQPQDDKELGKHLVFMADRRVDIAHAQAQGRLLEDQRKSLSAQRETERLDSRTHEADELRKQIAELNAKATDRGLVVTIGDLLFETGKSDLKGGSASQLSKLSAFLNKNQDRTVTIEGHTDSIGGEEYNQGLSQRRADSVKSFLTSQGIASSRLESTGKGKSSPISSNDSSTGRQQNRRVEVIISNPPTSSR